MPRTSDSQSTFRAHVERLQAEYLPLRLSEADTRSYLVDPVLRLLGYAGVKHLRREVPVPATKEFIDYELLIDGKPHAIVEAKAMRHSVTPQHAAQCVQYASVLGVRWCLITNGIMWALYDAHAKGPLDEKRVAEVRLDGDAAATEHAWTVLALFSREAVAASSPLTTLLIERVLADELSKPDSKAVSELRRAVRQRFGERVTGSAVVDALLRWGQRMAHTAVPAGPSERDTAGEAPGPPQAREKRRQARAQRHAAGSRSSPRVTLADLIEASLLPPNAALEARVQGVSHIARVRDGAIDLDGTRYETPSAASLTLRQKPRNGWVDWHYKGKSLADLREQLRGTRSAVPAGPSERDTAGEAPGPPQAREKRRQARAQRHAAGSRSPPRVTLADLIEASLLPPDAALEARVQGVSHIARVRDGAIDLDGTRYETPSAASLTLRQKPRNGWVDWHYKGKSLADLREQLRGRRSAESHVT